MHVHVYQELAFTLTYEWFHGLSTKTGNTTNLEFFMYNSGASYALSYSLVVIKCLRFPVSTSLTDNTHKNSYCN